MLFLIWFVNIFDYYIIADSNIGFLPSNTVISYLYNSSAVARFQYRLINQLMLAFFSLLHGHSIQHQCIIIFMSLSIIKQYWSTCTSRLRLIENELKRKNKWAQHNVDCFHKQFKNQHRINLNMKCSSRCRNSDHCFHQENCWCVCVGFFHAFSNFQDYYHHQSTHTVTQSKIRFFFSIVAGFDLMSLLFISQNANNWSV